MQGNFRTAGCRIVTTSANHRAGWWICARLLATVLVHATAARAEDKYTWLDEKQIRAKIIGKEITDSVHWSEYYRRDGTLLSMDMGHRRTGAWKIEQNKLCSAKEKGKPFDCYEVWISGSKVSLRIDKDDTDFIANIEKHLSD
jgi:hypothetical protein